MITRELIEALVDASPSTHPVTSVYLDTDPQRHSGTEYTKVLEHLFDAKRAELASSDVSKEHQRGILQDFAKIGEWLSHQSPNESKKSFAVFSAAATGLWQALSLPRRLPSLVVVDNVPYARPLAVLADEYECYGAVAVDRHRGRIFEVFMGEIQEIADLVDDDVPKKPRKMGHTLKSETSVMRHVGELWRVHWKDIADRVLLEDRRRRFDHMVLGGPPQDVAEFEKSLHSTLQRKVAGRFHGQVELDSIPSVVLRQVREIENSRRREREATLLDTLMSQAQSGKLGTVGLSDTMKALHAGQVHTLILDEGLRADGVYCPTCRFIGVMERTCPTCNKSMQSAPDVVDLAIAEAIRQGCEVRHIVVADALASVGGIGALLRYRM